MQVRERRIDDLEELVVISARVQRTDGYPLHLPDGDFLRFLTRPEPLNAWVAEHDGAIAGHVALNAETSPPVMQLASGLVADRAIAFVARLLVDPNTRRHGVGARLLDRARREAVARNRLPMLDVVDTPAAAPAISLYRSKGWEEVGRTPFKVVGGDELEELVFRGPV